MKSPASPAGTLNDQLPPVATVELPPENSYPLEKETVTVAPASADPLMVKPAAFSAASTTFSPAIAETVNPVGALLSSV